MRIDGGCHCGEITYEARVDPDRVVICHCTDCQAFSGAPYRVSVPVLVENLTLRGEPRTYVKHGDRGAEVTQAFCPRCGSSLYSQKDPSYVFLRLGGVRQRADMPPKLQGFTRSAMRWAMDIREVPIAR